MTFFRPVIVTDECQRDVNHLFCSLNSLIKYFKSECPGKDDVDACSSCQIEMAKIYENNSWILTCKFLKTKSLIAKIQGLIQSEKCRLESVMGTIIGLVIMNNV